MKHRTGNFWWSEDGDAIYKCPYCKQKVNIEDCDCLGADKDCLFCGICGEEFHEGVALGTATQPELFG